MRKMRRNIRRKRRSSCMAPTQTQMIIMPPFRFFRIILPFPSVLDHNLLRLPDAFTTKFRNQISEVATLIIPTGTTWTVRLIEKDKQLYFEEGWETFMKDNVVKLGYFLEFEYFHENATFNVHIFDLSCCEITYPRLGSNDQTRHSPKQVDNQHIPDKEVSFSILARPSQAFLRSNYLHIPRSFDKHMRRMPMQLVKLQVEDGREWNVECYYTKCGFRLRGNEWTKFTQDTDWGVEADLYDFLLLSQDPHCCLVFKVIPLGLF
ncbi:B3 domain-containing transcription factor VRN1-like [Silene latifolia]|uniref:B3 domain-containing transcription factor VRN1-like n=1 Tax=Silene latifolia TaxID=37657 RepID=UPI003D773352